MFYFTCNHGLTPPSETGVVYRIAMAPFLYALTLPNTNRSSKYFHCQNQEKICNNTITKDPITPKLCRYTTLCPTTAPWRETRGIRLRLSSSLKVQVYPHSNLRGGLRKKHAFWNTVRTGNGALRSYTVVDFDTNRKRVCDFLLVNTNNLGPILPPFRYTCILQVS